MASAFKHPTTPKQAARRKSQLDRLLEPEFFKALGEPNRARLLACLIKCGRPCSVTEVAECCSVDFSVVARHLGALARAGLVEATKEGRTVWYQARSHELIDHLQGLVRAIEEWSQVEGCESDGCC